MSAMSTAMVCDQAIAVTPSDTADNSFSYLYVGGAGNVALEDETGGAAVTYLAVAAGSYLWIRTRRVRATGTTATGIIGHR